MPDIVDDAQAQEAEFIAGAIANAKPAPGPAPVKINGRTCCAECEQPIPFARLAAMPGVGLCVVCAEELVQIMKGW